jgi:hypothetical protein
LFSSRSWLRIGQPSCRRRSEITFPRCSTCPRARPPCVPGSGDLMHASVSKLGVMARRARQFDLRLRQTSNLGANRCLCRTPRQTQHSTRCWLKRQSKTTIRAPTIAPL